MKNAEIGIVSIVDSIMLLNQPAAAIVQHVLMNLHQAQVRLFGKYGKTVTYKLSYTAVSSLTTTGSSGRDMASK